MKKFVCFLVAMAMLIPMCTPFVSANGVILSELSESQCIAFLKDQGVEIPGDFENELSWGPFVKEIIACVEKNPNVVFAYNYHVTHNFANAIKAAVNEYYGTENQIMTSMQQRAVYSLQDSVVYGAWSDSFELYNCYAYAIDVTDDWLCPGDLSGYTYTVNLSVYTVAKYVKADLEEIGYTNVTITDTAPTSSTLDVHEKAICVRIKGGVDFHFMKLDDNRWFHKPSYTNTLRYKYNPSDSRVWTNEASYKGIPIAPTIEYSSKIQYIIYSEPHTYSYKYDNSDSHILTCTVCGETTGTAVACIYVNNICKVCGHYKITGSIMSYDGVSACTAS